jgi:hypothetical protein
MRIQADGSVGIGTMGPMAKLHLWDSASLGLRIETSSTSGSASLKGIADTSWFSIDAHATSNSGSLGSLSWLGRTTFTASSDLIIAGGTANNRVFLGSVNNSALSAGGSANNVGINTVAPNETLEVQGSARIGIPGGPTTLNGSIDSSTATIAVVDASNLPLSGVVIIDGEAVSYSGKSSNTLTGAARGQLGTSASSHISSAPVSPLLLSVRDGAAAPKLAVAANGHVGIGTAAPTAALDVAGNLRIHDGTQGNSRVLTSDSQGNAAWAQPGVVSGTGALKIDSGSVLSTGLSAGATAHSLNFNGSFAGPPLVFLTVQRTGTQGTFMTCGVRTLNISVSGFTLETAGADNRPATPSMCSDADFKVMWMAVGTPP